MAFWDVTIQVLSIQVTAVLAALTLVVVACVGWRVRSWPMRLTAFVMLAWLMFEISAIFGFERVVQIGLSRYARALTYLAALVVAWATWRRPDGS